jgi:hypothetical protein
MLPAPPPALNHVFVDFENVHRVDASMIGAQGFHFTLFLGAKQTKISADLVEKLMQHANSVQLIRLSASGRNAVDFCLAYYIGRAVITDPTGCYHIVSKDSGFDPLIEHLRSRNIHAQRHHDFTTLHTTRTAAAKAAPCVPSAPAVDTFTRVLEHLRRNVSNRPRRKKTLIRHLLTVVGKSANEPQVIALIEKLSRDGHLTIGDKEAVTYHASLA